MEEALQQNYHFRYCTAVPCVDSSIRIWRGRGGEVIGELRADRFQID